MERNLGRIQACHPQVADLYEMSIEENKQGTRLVWRQKPEQQQWLEAREGAYLLRTNLKADSPPELWKKYIQLTEVEPHFVHSKASWPSDRSSINWKTSKSACIRCLPRLCVAGDAETSTDAKRFGLFAG